MKWNRFNLLSPAGERRGRPPTDIAAEVAAAAVVVVVVDDGQGGPAAAVAAPSPSPLVNEISATTGRERY